MKGEADPLRGRVALGFLHTLGGEIVPRLVRDFRASYPGVRFALVQDGSQRLLARLREGEIDLCLTAPLPSGPEVRARGLAEQRIDLFVPVGHRLAAERGGLPLAEAAAEDFIVMEPGYGLRAITDAMCHEAGFEPRITFEGEEADTARGLVGAGLGVSLLPATVSSLADPSVVPVRVTAPRAIRTVGIAWAADRPLTAPAAMFRDFALTYAGRLLEAGTG
jgi:DNA-binding transcriptional LysR family regulator